MSRSRQCRGRGSLKQLSAAGGHVEGDASALGRLLAALDEPGPAFAIVTP